MSKRRWFPVVAVSAGIFSIVTTEILPIGLLTSIASSFQISHGTAGVTMTIPGLVAAVAAPAFTVATGRLDRRTMLCVLMLVLALADLLAALAPHYGVLVFSRVLVGLVIGGFWSIGTGLPVRLVESRSVGLATAVVFSAVPLGSVLGVPAGTLIGHLAGWRAAFVVMALFTVAVLVALAVLLPPLPASQVTDLAALRRVVRLPGIRLGLVATVLIVVAHFATYTYVTPFLRSVTGVGEGSIGGFLLVYGIAGIVGNFVAGALITRRLSATFAVAMGTIALVTLALPIVAVGGVGGHGPVLGLLVLWGLAYGAVPVCSGAWFARSSVGLEEAGTVLWVSAFQASLSVGAYLGGVVVDATSVSLVMVLGGICALSAAAPFVALAVARRASRVRVPAGR